MIIYKNKPKIWYQRKVMLLKQDIEHLKKKLYLKYYKIYNFFGIYMCVSNTTYNGRYDDYGYTEYKCIATGKVVRVEEFAC